MKNLIFMLISLSSAKYEEPTVKITIDRRDVEIKQLASNNGFKVSDRTINAILNASNTYDISHLELTAIGIIETGLGKFAKTVKNKNGTHDRGVFQINTANYQTCIEYNLDSVEGSSLCAAKLLSKHKATRSDYLGVYHSKTCRPDFCPKKVYLKKVNKILASLDK